MIPVHISFPAGVQLQHYGTLQYCSSHPQVWVNTTLCQQIRK